MPWDVATYFLRSDCLVGRPQKLRWLSFEKCVCTDRHGLIRVSINLFDDITQC